MNRVDSQARQIYWMTRFSHTGTVVQRASERGEVAPETDPSVVMTALTGALYVRMLVLEARLDAPFLAQIERLVLEGLVLKQK